MKKIFYIIYMLCILNFPLNAQNKIQIINSDNSQMLNDADYIKLYGNCHFRHNGNDMYCDTLYLYDNKNYIEAFGNVKIIQEDAEKGTTTIKSDSLKYDGNKNIATFINNVNMLNNNTTLLTNLFVYNTKDKIGTYYNEGTILNKTDVLKSETGTYNIATKIADFSKNVSITSSSNTILTNLITYDNNLQKAYFKVPTKIIDNTDKSFIYSEEGDYNTNSTETNLYKNSYYSSEDKYFTADTMVLNEKLKTNTLTNNTLIIDKKNNTHIVSNFASSNQTTSNSLITNNVLIKSIQNNDPFYLTADTILAYDTPKDKILIPDISELTNNHSIDIKDIEIIHFFTAYYPGSYLLEQLYIPKHSINYALNSSKGYKVYNSHTYFINDINKTHNKILKEYPFINENTLNQISSVIKAYKKVKVYNDSLQLVADSFIYIKNDSLLYITDNPVLWIGENTQITSKNMLFTLKDSKLHRGYFIDNPIIINQNKDDINKFNEIKGRSVTANFIDNKLNKLIVDGNAESIYHIKDENKLEKNTDPYVGINSTKASKIELLFKNSDLVQTKYITDPIGSITPYNDIEKKDLHLEGFVWHNNLRPKSKKDLLPIDRSNIQQKYINDL